MLPSGGKFGGSIHLLVEYKNTNVCGKHIDTEIENNNIVYIEYVTPQNLQTLYLMNYNHIHTSLSCYIAREVRMIFLVEHKNKKVYDILLQDMTIEIIRNII